VTAEPATPPSARRRWLGPAILAVAIAAAAAVALYLLLSGDAGSASGDPERVVHEMYRQVEQGDPDAFAATLDPAVRDDPARTLIPFGSTAGAFEVGQADAELDDIQTDLVNEQAGWASVAVSGRATIDGTVYLVQETQYLRQLDDAWFVSTPAIFFAENGDAPPASGDNADLGPIDPERPEVGQPAPDFALLDARDGTVRKLSEFRGRAVAINWYASWCGPCKAEIPEFQAAYAALPEELVFLGVNYLESPERATGILDIYNAEYPAVLDSSGDVADHYRVGYGLPATFFVNAEGILTGIHYGQVRSDDLVTELAKAGVTYAP
jgi:thiol-disulfide isomerase/thioredoxin